jgi:uncharacterized protein (DUF111 family)
MASEVLLLLVQIDDAPGELLGDVVRTLGEMGAKNVQLLSSLAKKGRPGYVLLIDILAQQEAEVAALLVGELGVWGYRVLRSDHKHFDIERHDMTLDIAVGDTARAFPMRIKRILNQGAFMRAKAEFDDLRAICSALGNEGVRVSLAVLKAKVEVAVGSGVPSTCIRIVVD